MPKKFLNYWKPFCRKHAIIVWISIRITKDKQDKMSIAKPLSRITIEPAQIKADRKKCRKYDQCGLGEKAIYMGSTMHPRNFYIPYEAVTNVFKRVGASNPDGKGFLAPVLFIVVRYDDGKEQQCSFRYLQDADKMLDDLEKNHPEIPLLSPEGIRRKKEREATEARIQANDLSAEALHSKKVLEDARWEVHKRPALYEKLAAMAKMKRHADLMKPSIRYIAVGLLAAGIAVTLAGIYIMRNANRSVGVVAALFGIMLVFLAVNSKGLPSKMTNRKLRDREYEDALTAMKNSLRHLPDFPIPYCYAHPYTFDRMIRILQEERAQNEKEALEVLKADLKAMDSSVALSGDDFKQVVTIKPLFTVQDYK